MEVLNQKMINVILKTKSKRNIIICNSNTNVEEILKKYKLKKWMFTKLNVYKFIYYGNVYFPPFFDNIICIQPIKSIDEVYKIWNMTVLNGYFIINSNYKNLFKSFIIDEDENYILVKRLNTICYQFKNERFLDFIIAGTMKGGTTAAQINLSKHPDISMTEYESHFFDKIYNYCFNEKKYKSQFDYSKKMVGDKDPDIMYQEHCLDFLLIKCPQVKIIIILRNPIDRAYSQWKMLNGEIFKNSMPPFELCVEDEINNRMGEFRNYWISLDYHLIQRGFYYEQIEKILKFFPPHNLCILISEKVRENMDNEYQKVFKFLNLPEYHGDFKEEYVSSLPDILHKNTPLYKKLKKIFDADKKKLEKFLGYKTGWW